MRQLNGFTKKVLFNYFNESHYLRLSAFNDSYVQKLYKSSIASPIKSLDKLVVNKNMTLRYCRPKQMNTNTSNDRSEERPTRPLAVLFSWMLSKDKHLEKYRDLYFKRGFDVLTVNTSPFELLLPERGSKRIARNVLTFLNDRVKDYPQIVIHAFSVGGYQFGEMLVELEKNENKPILKTMNKAVKGLICDSVADVDAIPIGLSGAVSKNPVLRAVFKKIITTHLKLFHSIATKHYLASYTAFKRNAIACPGLILTSAGDPVGTPESHMKFRETWERSHYDVYWKCFDNSSHVSHFLKYPEEYEREIDSFLKKIIK